MGRRQILCLSGGGYAGLFAIKFLALLEEQLPGANARIGDRFDAIAGTSVGGLIALALAAGKSAREIHGVMQRAGSTIFPRKPGGVARMIWGPKHAVAPLRRHAQDLLGAKCLGALSHPILIPAVTLSTGEPKLFRAVPGKDDPDKAVQLLDVALATSAAPLYFKPHRLGTSLFADGGLIANSPDPLIILDALHRYGWPVEDLWVLSIGTTYTPPGVLTHSDKRWGLAKWLARDRKLLAISMHAQMRLAHEIATSLLPRDRLLRVDPVLSPAQAATIGLDVANTAASSTLQALAQAELDRMDGAYRRLLSSHTRRPP